MHVCTGTRSLDRFSADDYENALVLVHSSAGAGGSGSGNCVIFGPAYD
jgi:hypothetical protein